MATCWRKVLAMFCGLVLAGCATDAGPQLHSVSPAITVAKSADIAGKPMEILGKNCRSFFDKYVSRAASSNFGAYAYSGQGIDGAYVCSGGYGWAVEDAVNYAISDCQRRARRYASLRLVPCRLFAVGDKIVWKDTAKMMAATNGLYPGKLPQYYLMKMKLNENSLSALVTVEHDEEVAGNGEMRFDFPGKIICFGSYDRGTNTDDQKQPRWEFSCTNDFEAAGAFLSFDAAAGALATGQSSDSDHVRFSLLALN